MKTGFIGLGNLGRAMAQRLISEQVDLIIWNRTRSKTEKLDATIADSPADLISKSDIVFLNLADSNAVRAVLESSGGLLQGDCGGKIIIDTTTNHFDSVANFYRQLAEHGASYLESPVLGSVVPASQGNLTILVSGDRKSYDASSPLLEKLGKKIYYLGKPSLATKMKLINNLVLGSLMTTLAEALSLAEKAGISRQLTLDVLGNGAGNSALLNGKREKLLTEDFSPQFSIAMIYKDLGYLEDLARSLSAIPFNAIVARQLFGKAIPLKMENLDFSAVYKILKSL